jgi:phosphate-selective porin OprO/OprP
MRQLRSLTLAIAIGAVLVAPPRLALAKTKASKSKASPSNAELLEKIEALESKVDSLEQQNAKLAQQQATARQVSELDQQVRTIDRKQEIAEQASSEKAKTAPKIEAGPNGFLLSSADGDYKLRVGGYIQADGRYFTTKTRGNGSTFIIRRVRPILEGTIAKYYDFKFMADFGQGSTTLQDAYIGTNFFKGFRTRTGQFKEPVSLERLQDDRYLTFAERALPVNIVPDRDLGMMFWGDLLGDRLTYQLGVFNGVPDNVATANFDMNNSKDFAGRFLAHPFHGSRLEALDQFGLGLSGTYGDERTSGVGAASITGGNVLTNYRTAGQTTFFTWAAGTVAAGYRYRIAPQANWLYGPWAVQGEWVQETQNLGHTGFTAVTVGKKSELTQPTRPISNQSWQTSIGYMLTGEDNSFTGIKPRHPFDPFKGTWGAFQLAARADQLLVDRQAFTQGFASKSTSAREAFEWGAGLNWYLNQNVILYTDYFNTNFIGGNVGGSNKTLESVFYNELEVIF